MMIARQTLSRRGAQFTLLAIAACSAAYARAIISPLQESLEISLHLNDAQTALIQGPALALPFLFVAVPLGLAIDRFSRVRLLLLFTLLQALGTALSVAATGFIILFAARCIIGFTTTAISTTALSILADLWAESYRGRANMILVIGQFAGMALAFLVGGALLALPSLHGDWRLALTGLCIPLVLVVWAMMYLHEPARTGVEVNRPTLRQTGRELWAYRLIIGPITLGVVTAQMSVAAVLTWAAPAIERTHAVSSQQVGSLIAVGLIVSGLAGPIGGGYLADRSQSRGGPAQTMRLLAILSFLSAPAGLFALSNSMNTLSVLFVLFIALITALCVIAMAAFTIVVPNELRGLSVALLASASSIFGDGLAPVLVGTLARRTAEGASIAHALAILCAVASLAGAVFFLLARMPLIPLRRAS